MIVGFNTDIKQGDKVYHVQTEDKGLNNPLIESLVYFGGAILDSKRMEYEKLLKEGYDEQKIMKLREVQHRRVIADIKSGKYDTDKPPEEEGDCILDLINKSPRTLDEVVLEWLSRELQQEKLDLILSSKDEFFEGLDARVNLKALSGIARKALAGVEICINLVSSKGVEKNLYEGITNENGELDIVLKIPSNDGSRSAIIIRGDSQLGKAEIKQLVRQKK